MLDELDRNGFDRWKVAQELEAFEQHEQRQATFRRS